MTPAARPPALAQKLPRIDLHLHLEGSLPRTSVRSLAERHRVAVPSMRRFDGFRGFLKAFGAVADLLVDEEDYRIAAASVIEQARRRCLAHVEILFSPQVAMRRGVPVARMMDGLLRARREAVRGAPTVVYIADGVRQWGSDWFLEMVKVLGPWAGRGLEGIGLGGDESSRSVRAFAPAYRLARSLGLRTTVHAGETGVARSVDEAVRWLRPDRIGHGVGAIRGPAVVRRLVRKGITLEVCPGSNVATGCVPDLARHPLRRLIAAGVKVTVNSDDGSFFGTDVVREMRRVVRVLGVTHEEALGMTMNAARAAFLPERARARLERRIVRSVRSPS